VGRLTRGSVSRLAVRCFISVLILGVFFPLFWVLRVAFEPNNEFVLHPSSFGGSWTFGNFAEAWVSGGLASAVGNSVVVVSLGTAVAVIVGALTGYGLARFRFTGRTVMLGAVVSVLFLPMAALVIPLFDEAVSFGILGSRITLGVIYGAIFSAWTTLFLKGYFEGIPAAVFEAAELDGASVFRTFMRVAVPLASPALAAAAVLNIFIQWSELLLALVLLPIPDTQTAAIAVARFNTVYRTGVPVAAAVVVIAAIPVILAFLVGQRWLRAAALSGAVNE
jgi:multiple sugar transport system permease protein